MKYAREKKQWEDWEIIFHHFVPGENAVTEKTLHPANLILNTAERKSINNLTCLKESIRAGIGGENYDHLIELEITIAEVGFAWGFVLGQIFDFPDLEGKKSIQALRGKIFRSGVLPYITLEQKKFTRVKQHNKLRRNNQRKSTDTSDPSVHP